MNLNGIEVFKHLVVLVQKLSRGFFLIRFSHYQIGEKILLIGNLLLRLSRSLNLSA